MKIFWQKICKLINVKTIVTFALTATFVYMAMTDKIDTQIFMTIYTVIIGWYFGSQANKNDKEE